MIKGIGCDVVHIPRITKILNENRDRFLSRIFSENELELMHFLSSINPNYIAKRFAAKEAFSKATGCGIGSSFRFKDIEILKDIGTGRPFFSSKTLLLAGKDLNAFLSMSDDENTAIAQVVFIQQCCCP